MSKCTPWDPTCAALLDGDAETPRRRRLRGARVRGRGRGASLGAPAEIAPAHNGAISALAYSPPGEAPMLAVADATREIKVYKRDGWAVQVENVWRYHSTKITGVSWAPSGAFLATCSLDETVYVWELASPRKFAAEIKYAHKDGVTCVGWLSDDQLSRAATTAACACEPRGQVGGAARTAAGAAGEAASSARAPLGAPAAGDERAESGDAASPRREMDERDVRESGGRCASVKGWGGGGAGGSARETQHGRRHGKANRDGRAPETARACLWRGGEFAGLNDRSARPPPAVAAAPGARPAARHPGRVPRRPVVARAAPPRPRALRRVKRGARADDSSAAARARTAEKGDIPDFGQPAPNSNKLPL